MSPRNSHVDIVQAVGRVMRKAEGKQYGYIVLPVAIPAGADPADILNDNQRFASVWNVDILRALRSHDDRLNAEINRIDLNTATPDRIIFTGPNEDEDGIGLSSASAHIIAIIPSPKMQFLITSTVSCMPLAIVKNLQTTYPR